ncbi:MAG: efflux transporter periplasmic adaptor subunit [Sphingomonadales bacterium]|nr:efflux transporter periplasmic adaptor subunit [Sphingomonadales bacterium]
MRFLTRSLMGLFLFALTIALIGAAGFAIKAASEARAAAAARPMPSRERVFAANVVALEFTRVTPELTAYGQIRATRSLELRAAAAGTVAEIAPDFEEGAEVAAGTLLVRLDPAEAEAARDSAVASLAEAEAALALAERNMDITRDDLAAAERQAALRGSALERQLAIDDRGLGRAADTETAQLALSSAEQAVLTKRAQLSSAEAALDQARNARARARIALSEAERKLRDTEIRAEFAGRLANVAAVRGGQVANNEKLGDLIDPSALEVAFRVSTAQFARLIDGTGRLLPLGVDLSLDTSGRSFAARAELVRVGAAVEEGLTGRLLFARITAGAEVLQPGDFVTVRLAEPALDQVALIPAAALDAAGRVLVLGPEDRLTEVQAEVLHRQGDQAIIRAALPAGTEIVAERTPLLGEGIKLRPLRPAGATAAPAVDEVIVLDPERRARLIAFVEGNTRMPAETKARFMAQLNEEAVPASVVARLEERIGG